MKLVRTSIPRQCALPDDWWERLQLMLIQLTLDEADQVLAGISAPRATCIRELIGALRDYQPEDSELGNLMFVDERIIGETRYVVYLEDACWIADCSGDDWAAPRGTYVLLWLDEFRPVSSDKRVAVSFIAVWFDKRRGFWRVVDDNSDCTEPSPSITVVRWEIPDAAEVPSIFDVIKATFEAERL